MSIKETGNEPCQAATPVLFDAAIRDHKIAPGSVSLFINGEINPIARRCIAQSLQAVRAPNPSKPSAYLFSQLTGRQLDEFFEKMKAKPASEQQFLLASGTVRYPLLHLLTSKIGLMGFFHCAGEHNQPLELIPSFEMMQTLLDVKYGVQAPKLDPSRIALPQPIESSPLPRGTLARLHLSYNMLLGNTTAGDTPENVLRRLLKDVVVTPALREEIALASKQIPNDPFLALLGKLVNEAPQAKL